jgi:uncharacterized protein (TIGR02246 family)
MSDESADIQAIRNLVARYSDAVNRRDAEAWGDCWAEQGSTWKIMGMAPENREGIVGLWTQLMSGFPFVVQMPSECLVEVSGDVGTVRAYLTETGKGPDGQGMLTLGVYHDRVQRDPDGWRFSERAFNAMYSGPMDMSGEPAGFPEDRK